MSASKIRIGGLINSKSSWQIIQNPSIEMVHKIVKGRALNEKKKMLTILTIGLMERVINSNRKKRKWIWSAWRLPRFPARRKSERRNNRIREKVNKIRVPSIVTAVFSLLQKYE